MTYCLIPINIPNLMFYISAEMHIINESIFAIGKKSITAHVIMPWRKKNTRIETFVRE